VNDNPLAQEFSGEAALRLRVYIGERDHHGGQPLYTAIVHAARVAGLSGATVVKGIEGYGAHSVVHAARIVDMSSDLPLVVEIVDSSEKVRAFVPALKELLDEGMMTIESVAIIYRNAGKPRS
jgi:PII-like signaling protein